MKRKRLMAVGVYALVAGFCMWGYWCGGDTPPAPTAPGKMEVPKNTAGMAAGSDVAAQNPPTNCCISVSITLAYSNLCVGCSVNGSLTISKASQQDSGGAQCMQVYTVKVSCASSAVLSVTNVVVNYDKLGAPVVTSFTLTGVKPSTEINTDEVKASYCTPKGAVFKYTVVQMGNIVVEYKKDADKNKICEGEAATAVMEDMRPSGYPVKWSLVTTIPGVAKGDVAIDESSGLITLAAGVWFETAVIQAEAADIACPEKCRVQRDVKWECCACTENGCSYYGQGDIKAECVGLVFHLGKAAEGAKAGKLYLRSPSMSAALATPAALKYSARPDEVQMLFSTNGVIRQARAPQGLVDIEALDAFRYEIRYYYAKDVGNTNETGFYQVTDGPFVTWVVENPSGSTNDCDTLRVSRVVGSDTNVTEFSYDPGQEKWHLSKGNGLRIETKEARRLPDASLSSNRMLRTSQPLLI